ncbi:hypothetical protein ACFQZC_00880 [Streptacidiphilus monticola]
MLQRVTQTEYELLREDLQITEQDSAPAQEEWGQVPQGTVPLTDPQDDETEADASSSDTSPPQLSVFTAFTAATIPSPTAPATGQGTEADGITSHGDVADEPPGAPRNPSPPVLCARSRRHLPRPRQVAGRRMNLPLRWTLRRSGCSDRSS